MAEDQELGGSVALKTIRPEIVEHRQALTRLRKETHLSRKVTHPNICRIFDFARESDVAFITMEPLTGETLPDRFYCSESIPVGEANPVVLQMIAGLTAAHRAGVIHRDFKPGNVYLVPKRDGTTRVVITDFGLARTVESGQTATKVGQVVGTSDARNTGPLPICRKRRPDQDGTVPECVKTVALRSKVVSGCTPNRERRHRRNVTSAVYCPQSRMPNGNLGLTASAAREQTEALGCRCGFSLEVYPGKSGPRSASCRSFACSPLGKGNNHFSLRRRSQMQSRKIGIGVVLLVLCVFVGIAVALTFVFRDVNATLTAQETDTYGLNDKSAIVGDYVDSAGIQHGMILGGTNAFIRADRPDCVTTPGSTSISFYGINSASVAAGWCTNTSGVEIGFTYSKGAFTDIHIAGASLTNVNGINDAGAVVGTYIDSNGAQHGFLLVGSTLTNLDPPGTTSVNTAWGINNAGVITVYGVNSSGTYLSFTTADGGHTYTPFHAPGEGPTGTVIHQINNNGDIIGTYFDGSGNRHGVLFHGGQYFSFDDPNGVGSTRADGLNNALLIVGRYGSGVYGGTGFLAVTQP